MATAGNLIFGSPISNPIPYAASPEGALSRLAGPAEQRATMLFWITRAIVLELSGDPEQALAVLNEGLDLLDKLPGGPPQGIELLQLFRGSAALYSRDYATALSALDDALAKQPGYVNALMLKGSVFTDRSQIFYVKDRKLSDEEKQCITTPSFAQAPVDQAVAQADARGCPPA